MIENKLLRNTKLTNKSRIRLSSLRQLSGSLGFVILGQMSEYIKVNTGFHRGIRGRLSRRSWSMPEYKDLSVRKVHT
jgi:hypothetical protein